MTYCGLNTYCVLNKEEDEEDGKLPQRQRRKIYKPALTLF